MDATSPEWPTKAGGNTPRQFGASAGGMGASVDGTGAYWRLSQSRGPPRGDRGGGPDRTHPDFIVLNTDWKF